MSETRMRRARLLAVAVLTYLSEPCCNYDRHLPPGWRDG